MLNFKWIIKEFPSSPLIVLVHGRKGNLDAMTAFRSILPQGASVVSVQAPHQEPDGGFSWWFKPGFDQYCPHFDQQLENSVQLFENWLETLLQRENLLPSKIIGIGFSQGAALLTLFIQVRSDIFSSIAMLAGFALEHPLHRFEKKEGITLPEIFMTHGRKDEIVTLEIARESLSLLQSWGLNVDFLESDAGHKVPTSAMRSLKDWLKLMI